MKFQGKRRIAVSGGGTAGHILPAVEFLQTYRQEFGAEGCFIGSPGMEETLVPARGERLALVPGRPWERQGWSGKIRSIANLPASIAASRRVLLRERIQLVIGCGSYASVGPCLAASSLGIPFVIHEANAKLGVANRFLARFARMICVSFRDAAHGFEHKTIVTGTPVGKVALSSGLSSAPWHFIVLGGSEGSPVVNREAPKVFAELRRRNVPFSVHHVAGCGDREEIERAYRSADVTARVDNFVDDMGSVYARATLAISSAGGKSLAELSAAGVPAFLSPLAGAARGHQQGNAQVYADATGSRVLSDDRWDAASLANEIEALLQDAAELQRRSQLTAAWAPHDASLRVVQACEGVLSSTYGTAVLPAGSPLEQGRTS